MTVGVILIPQSMAYAILAGLPPIYGLYACTIPLFVYAMLASSTQLQIGTVATTALLLRSTVAGLHPSSDAEFIQLAIGVTFVAGVLQIAFGLLRLGFVARLLSGPVMVGYTAATALIIFGSQLKNAFGLRGVGMNDSFFLQMVDVFRATPTAHAGTSILSIITFAILRGSKRLPLPKWFPVPLLVMVITTAMSYFNGFANVGIACVGACVLGRVHGMAFTVCQCVRESEGGQGRSDVCVSGCVCVCVC